MNCAGCKRAFTKSGAGAQAQLAPALCRDCTVRELAYHGFHAPDAKCLDKYMEGTR